MHTTYRPGPWYLIVLPGVLVALPPETPSDVVRTLWDRMPGQRSLATVLDVLATQAGGDFGALPPFVAAVADGTELRIALRGDVSAQVSTAGGVQHFSGAELTTWSERFVSDAARVEIALGAGDDGAELPLESGIVHAAAASADLDAQKQQPAEPVVASESAVERPTEQEPAHAPEPEPAPEAAPEPEPEREPEPAPVADPEPAPEPGASSLPDVTLLPSEVTLAPTSEDFDQLWGATVHSAPDAGAERAPAVPASAQGDHDGATISVSELRALREQAPPAADAPTAILPVVPAATGRVRVSTGQVVTLDRTVIIGRRPRSARAGGANLPHLIAVDSPQQDISRSHLEIRPEGDTVVVIDLHTTNGSTLLRNGADPVRLHPGEQTIVLSGDVVDLGDGVQVVFEDLP